MKISAEQQYKNFYQRFMHDPKKGVQQFLPEWMNDKSRSSVRAAQEVIASMQALINLRVAASKLIKDQQDFSEFKVWERMLGCKGFVGLRSIGKSYGQNLLQDLLESLSEIYKFNTNNLDELSADIRDISQYKEMAYELVCHGFDRNGAVCTPSDVGQMMARLGGCENAPIDVYCDYGFGLYLGSLKSSTRKINLVGDEDHRSSLERLLSKRLDVAYRQSEIGLDRYSLLERMLVELEWVLNYDYIQSKTLLINAAKLELPFFQSEDAPNISGELNHLLNYGYENIIVLVSNAYLNGGRGIINSEKIFKYCISKGLKKVIQLPMGAVGATHEAYSLLVFEPGAVTESIEFKVMDFGVEKDSGRLFQPAERGFGKPLRQVELNLKSISQDGEMKNIRESLVSVGDILKSKGIQFINNKRQSRLVSFEANRFMQSELPKNVRDRFEFGRLADYLKIYRIQHMQLGTPEYGVEYFEVGGNDINQFGKFDLSSLPKKYIDEDSKGRLEKAELNTGDLILCIRGSVGKVALIDNPKNLLVAPNQSFVKITLKKKSAELTPDFIYWWLSSKPAQQYIASKVLSVGVPRLSILDVGDIPLPIGPESEINLEMEQFKKWDLQVNEVMKKMHEAQEMSSRAFITFE
jgi:hypothetical protein